MKERKYYLRKSKKERPIRVFRMSEENYIAFRKWCENKGLTVSESIRVSVKHLMTEGDVKKLLEDPEMRLLAEKLLKETNKESVKKK